MIQHGFRIIVVIPIYNNAHKLDRCLESIRNQTMHFDAVVVDDASTDNTEEVFNHSVGGDSRFRYIKQPKRMGPLVSRLTGCRALGEFGNDLVITIDGDDEISDNEVFADIAAKYEEGWMFIYGIARTRLQERCWGRIVGSEYPEEVKLRQRYREHVWIVGFPRCFPYWTLDEIPESHFKINDEWVTASTDQALFLPIMELVGNRICCIQRICYFYHREVIWGKDHDKHVSVKEACRQIKQYRYARARMEPKVTLIETK